MVTTTENAGTREYHGDLVEQFAPDTENEPARAGIRVRRVQPPIERYLARDLITSEQYEAATRLRRDYEFGICGVNDSGRSGAGGGVPGYSVAQIDATAAYQHAVQALGKVISPIVLPVVLGYDHGGEITVEALSKYMGRSRKEMMGVFKAGLDMLAEHYGR